LKLVTATGNSSLCMEYRDVGRRGVTVPFIFNLGLRWRSVVSFKPAIPTE
jgi:hypothetical protein